MKIKVEIDVFDDPEFCESGDNECKRLIVGEYSRICGLYDDGAIYDFKIGQTAVRLKKCDQCKAAYHKALKENESANLGEFRSEV